MSEIPRRQTRTVAIVGAGIAGLTLALCLERQGFRVEVFERAEKAPTQGAGIQLSPNAFKIFSELSLDRTISNVATQPEFIQIYNGKSGEQLTEFQLGSTCVERHGAPYLVLHRADLQAILLTVCEALTDIKIHFKSAVVDVASHLNGVTLMLQRNGQLEDSAALAVVGADGIWSSMRKHVAGATPPQFTGSVAWRSLLNINTVPDDIPLQSTGLWIGPKAHIVTYPVRQGQMLNTVAVTPWGSKSPAPNGWLDGNEAKQQEAARLTHVKKWAPQIQTLLTKKSNWGGWPIFAVPEVGNLADGPICLIGDAAHAMVPYSAQGGASAIEDAAVLARCCNETGGNFQKAFQAFEESRTARLKQVSTLSYKNGKIYHLPFPASFFRNQVMKRLPQERLQERMDWLYGWTLDDLK